MVKYAAATIPSHKILMGLATYGYDWRVGSSLARAVSSAKAVDTAQNGNVKNYWDEVAQVPYYTYTENGVSRIVYYEDANSAAIKLRLLDKYKLGGIAIWRMGYEDPSLWDVLNSALKPQSALQ